MNRSPGNFAKKYIKSLQNKTNWRKCRRKLFPQRRIKASAPADQEYGAVEGTELTAEEFTLKKEEYLLSLKKNSQEREAIQIFKYYWLKFQSVMETGKIC